MKNYNQITILKPVGSVKQGFIFVFYIGKHVLICLKIFIVDVWARGL